MLWLICGCTLHLLDKFQYRELLWFGHDRRSSLQGYPVRRSDQFDNSGLDPTANRLNEPMVASQPLELPKSTPVIPSQQ